MLVETSKVTGDFLQGSRPVKKNKKSADFTAYIVFYLILGSGTGYPIF